MVETFNTTEMIAEDFKNTIKEVVAQYFGGDSIILEAAIEWHTVQAVKLMSGRHYSAPMAREYHEKYDPAVSSQAIEAVEIANNY